MKKKTTSKINATVVMYLIALFVVLVISCKEKGKTVANSINNEDLKTTEVNYLEALCS